MGYMTQGEETMAYAVPHGARAVANYLFDEVRQDRDLLTSMQLLKLVYISHGWSLAFFDRPLVREAVEAWEYGPVIADLYHGVKRWGAGPVRERLPGYFAATDGFSSQDMELVSSVLAAYRHLDGLELSNLTHRRGTPWYKVYYEQGGKNRRHSLIPNDLIREHFVSLMESSRGGR